MVLPDLSLAADSDVAASGAVVLATLASSSMIESFDRLRGANNATGLSVEGSRVLQAGSSGTKTATAAGNADAGNAHLLALRPAKVNLSISTPTGTKAGIPTK